MARVRFFGAVAAVAALALTACGDRRDAPSTGTVVRGSDTVLGTVRGDPQTFNHLLAVDNESILLSRLTQAGLVRINRTTDEVEPWLAEGWESAADGRTHTLTLRSGVTFSDGEPFTSADVLFTFEALYDASVDSWD